jgi:hypothetical protein
LGDHFGIHGGAAGRDAAQGADEFGHPADAVLEEVADAAAAVGEELAGVLALDVLR